MKDIESKISPLIAGLFPSFYGEDGPNFIVFIKAYYEWLEQNFQLLDLEDVTNFKVGDTIQQADVTGIIFSVDANSILVHVDGLETFKCFNVCSELIPVTSSSGGNTNILKGGTTRRLGTIFLSRNLSKIRDIDKTIDLFVVKFKEKYLKNIEFNTQSNKRLLVKNSLDLYRSKGTARSIDLFFRLLYGTKSSVYYPGDDLFRLSDAEWFKPQYIEINSTSVNRAIALVGKQVVGIRSEATAFVERYVKKKVNTGFVHVFYVSNVKGTFEVGEKLKYNQIFSDSPRVLGSFTEATVLEGSELFNVGDFVNFESDTGLGAVGRVTQTIKGTGEVSFTVANNGWGYTTNRKIDNTAPVNANTLLSEKTLLLANVVASQYLSSITPSDGGGTGYTNNDIITIKAKYKDAKAAPTTNANGSIVSIRVLDRGVGLTGNSALDTIEFANSTGGASNGTVIAFPFVEYSYPDKYFRFLETVTQPVHNITYATSVGIQQINSGMQIEVQGTGNFGTIIDINKTSNTVAISLFNNSTISPGQTIKTVSNNYVIVATVSLAEAKGQVVSVIPNGTIGIEPRDTVTYTAGDVVYQQDTANNIVASATITSTAQLVSQGVVSVANITGVFRTFANKLLVPNKPVASTNSVCSSVSLSIAIDTANTFVDNFAPFMYSSSTGTTAVVTNTTAGRDADFRIATLVNTDTTIVNTDRLNDTILNTRLDAVAYDLPFNPTANASSVLFGALDFKTVTIGSINTLGDINPGTGYNRDPYAVAYQPFVTGYQALDYVFTVSANPTNFSVGETITQNNIINTAKLFVANTAPFRVGELVHVANTTANFVANGIVLYANTVSVNNYIAIERAGGNFPVSFTGYKLKSFITTANSDLSSAVANTTVVIARGIVKENIGNKLYVKRIQLKNGFTANTITGVTSGTTAVVLNIEADTDSQPAGLNANIRTKASTADGVISQVQVVDSGFGFSNDSDLVFRSQTDDRTGVVSSVKGGVGTGTGYYRTAKGFASDISSIHDGDYYQEYSYDIISRIPLDKYSSMFKKVMHTAGTRYFGTVLIESLATSDTNITYANTVIEISTDSPLTVEDRESLDIQDINDFNIEIRE
jgi:hypothetical protein